MKYIISLFWSFIFAAVIVFIVSSILGSNGEISRYRGVHFLLPTFYLNIGDN